MDAVSFNLYYLSLHMSLKLTLRKLLYSIKEIKYIHMHNLKRFKVPIQNNLHNSSLVAFIDLHMY